MTVTKTSDWCNEHPEYGSQRIISRTYLCLECGLLIRHPARYASGGPLAPEHCGRESVLLSYEETVAATQLSKNRRGTWHAGGAHIAMGKGKRKWRPVMKLDTCHFCNRNKI